MKKLNNKYFIKKNICPYCTYPCESVTTIKGKSKPQAGAISFCIMCCQPSTLDENMILIKFDLNSITDLIERNRIKILGIRIEEFWEENPDKDGRREKYLKIFDQASTTGIKS